MAKKLNTAKIVVGYVRVSTEEQALGPEAQLASLKAWCVANGHELVAVHEDRGVSGATPVDKRPGLLAALESVRQHKASSLLVAKRDRLARDVVVAAVAERLVLQLGARVLTSDGAGNGDSPEASLMRCMLDAFSQYERAVIAARTKSALGAKKARGELVGDVPFGFELAGDGKKLVRSEAEQAVLTYARALRAEGLTYRELVERLNAESKTCRGQRWHLSSVHRLVSREAA
ncbi:MAG: recombinase family protein [Deltaproteobacteria bacterium]|nr:recombinase family protein [Deltaproteobacteria bacterium]